MRALKASIEDAFSKITLLFIIIVISNVRVVLLGTGISHTKHIFVFVDEATIFVTRGLSFYLIRFTNRDPAVGYRGRRN